MFFEEMAEGVNRFEAAEPGDLIHPPGSHGEIVLRDFQPVHRGELAWCPISVLRQHLINMN